MAKFCYFVPPVLDTVSNERKKPSGKAGLNPLTRGALREEKRGAVARTFERVGLG